MLTQQSSRCLCLDKNKANKTALADPALSFALPPVVSKLVYFQYIFLSFFHDVVCITLSDLGYVLLF